MITAIKVFVILFVCFTASIVGSTLLHKYWPLGFWLSALIGVAMALLLNALANGKL